VSSSFPAGVPSNSSAAIAMRDAREPIERTVLGTRRASSLWPTRFLPVDASIVDSSGSDALAACAHHSVDLSFALE
jgi:hypothetical protein